MITKFSIPIQANDREIRKQYPNCKFLMSIIKETPEYIYGELLGVSSSPESFLELCKYKNSLKGEYYIGGDYDIPSLSLFTYAVFPSEL